MFKYKEISIIIGVVILSLSVGMVFATWQEPTASPPDSNVEAPVNISSNTQEKLGKLIVNSLDSTSTVYAVGQITAGTDGFVTGASSLTGTILTVGSGGDSVIGGNLTVSGTSSLATTSFSNTKITDLSEPTASADAATKGYVDDNNIPSGLIAMFDTDCPTGWTRFTALDAKFPRGAASYGGTGGNESHTHDVDPPQTSITMKFSTGGTYSSREADYVDIPSFTSGAGSSLPPYLNVVWCKKD